MGQWFLERTIGQSAFNEALERVDNANEAPVGHNKHTVGGMRLHGRVPGKISKGRKNALVLRRTKSKAAGDSFYPRKWPPADVHVHIDHRVSYLLASPNREPIQMAVLSRTFEC
jgi:hypothetical protein